MGNHILLYVDAIQYMCARIRSYPYFFEGSNGESKRSMATEKKLSDVEIESDDDYELDEIEEHELDVSLYLAQIIQYSFPILISFLILYFFTTQIKSKQLQEEAEALKKECKRMELEIEEFTASNASYIESSNSIKQGTEVIKALVQAFELYIALRSN